MTTLLKPASLPELRRSHTLTTWRELDSLAEVNEATDVLMGNEKIVSLAERLDVAEPLWLEYLDVNGDGEELEKLVIMRQLGEMALLRHVVGQHVGETDGSDKIKELFEVLYDYYNPELFKAAVHQKIKKISSLHLPEDLEYARATVLDALEAYVGVHATSELEKPTDQTLQQIGDWINSQFDDLFDEIDNGNQERYKADDIAKYFQMAIDSTPMLRDNGWVVEIVQKEKNVISVHAEDKMILVPEQRIVTPLALKKLIIHEVFGHALRSAIAEENGIEVAQQGTATYTRFEESFMMALEQCFEGKHNPDRGIDHYLAIGLSVTAGVSKDEIAHLFESMHVLQNAEKGITDEVLAKAHRLTVAQIRRTFAGMTDVDDGIAYRKDIDYLHGLNDSWKLLNFIAENNIIDTAMPWLLSAKFNPFNEKERAYVNTFVAMPSELEAFFTNENEQLKGDA